MLPSEKILEMLKSGLSLAETARTVGTSRQNMSLWVRRHAPQFAHSRPGMPRTFDYEQVWQLAHKGMTAPKIAEKMGLAESDVYRAMRRVAREKGEPNPLGY